MLKCRITCVEGFAVSDFRFFAIVYFLAAQGAEAVSDLWQKYSICQRTNYQLSTAVFRGKTGIFPLCIGCDFIVYLLCICYDLRVFLL